jgi:diguanylate cyclase (GGDEF)-like protein
MKSETKYKAGAILIFLVMLLVAIFPFRTNQSVHATMREFTESLVREKEFDQLLDLMRDAETGQRGFVIAGTEDFLEPYNAAIANVPVIRATLTSRAHSPSEKKAIADIFAVATSKLEELAHTIELRRSGRFEDAQAVVISGAGKVYMNTLRQLIGDQVEQSYRRREILREALERKSDDALYADLIATAINFVLLGFLMLVMFRALKARQETATLLHTTAEELSLNVAETSLRNAQMEISAEMLQALASVSTMKETSHIVATYCAKLLPGLSGHLYLYRNSRDLLELHGSWGQPVNSQDQVDPNECWALQRGHGHLTMSKRDLCCKHYVEDTIEAGRLCVPLVTQSEVIGLLYIEGFALAEIERTSQIGIINRFTEQIALALSNVKLRETLRRQSITDPLTGLYNRRYMDETLKRELYRAHRKSLPLALIVLDLDHFKVLNDTFGHDAGDLVLKAAANQLLGNIRDSDLACRFGGEEFVLILPECDLDIAMARADAILKAIASLNVLHAGHIVGPTTASFGVAVYPQHGSEPSVLFTAADKAMYQAKNSGRNRVIAATALA